MAPVTIQDIKVILTQPAAQRLVVVKVITSEPGLYGLGCATFTQRFHAVVAGASKDTSSRSCSAATSPASRRSGRWRWSTATGATARC